MGKGRLEAFSDGVLAIIITIMVLGLKIPHGTDFEALKPLLPEFLSYILTTDTEGHRGIIRQPPDLIYDIILI